MDWRREWDEATQCAFDSAYEAAAVLATASVAAPAFAARRAYQNRCLKMVC